MSATKMLLLRTACIIAKRLSIAILLLSHVQWAYSSPITKSTKMEIRSGKTTPNEVEEPTTIEMYENYFNEIDVNDENADTKTRNAVQSPLQHWPGHIMLYKISNDYAPEEAENVRAAVRVFDEKTCLTFQEYNETRDAGKRYIRYMKSPNLCGTKVGYNALATAGTPHDVLLAPYCLTKRAVIQHETMHVLGLYHEQSRYDRNRHLQVIYDNIPQKYWSQFMAYPEIYTTTYNVPYDYESLMHYSNNAFAKDPNKPTMRARNGTEITDPKMGQLIGPSEGDLIKIRLMYRCP